MPLSLQIFYGAMERQVPLADYARKLDLAPDILRQALAGRLQGADSESVCALAKAINRDPEQMDLTTAPCDESFGMWLKRNMEGITQHALRSRAQLDNQTLKRFLNGDLLPDSDQAERISRALYIDRIEIARVVTANMAAAADPSTGGKRPKRRSKPGAHIQVPIVAMAADRPQDALSSFPPADTQEAGRDAGPVSAALPAPQGLQPRTQSVPMKKSRPRRQLNQAIASGPDSVVDASTSIQNGQQASMEEHGAGQPVVPSAGARAAILPPPEPAKQPTETEAGARRVKQSRTQVLANVAAAEQTPAPTEMNLAMDDMPVAEFAAEDRSSKRAASRRRQTTIGATATDVASSSAMRSALAAEIAPPKPDERSADRGIDRPVPLVTAELAADTTTLQLSSDEVRLIRHWRQLHPHGRRATLQYIGSLLVDD
jgi:hypothetical protein